MYDSGKPEAHDKKSTIHYTRLSVQGKPFVRSSDPDQNSGLADEIIIVSCRKCGTSFSICRSCWRRQAYCTAECRESVAKEKHCEAQHRYRQTEKGKAAHRKWEREHRRIGDPVDRSQVKAKAKSSGKRPESNRTVSKKNSSVLEKTMDDASSSRRGDGLKVVGSIATPPAVEEVKSSEKWATCLFCGQKGVVVARFQRRGYYRKKNGRARRRQ